MLTKRTRDENQKMKEGRKREEDEVRSGGKILWEKGGWVQEKIEGYKEQENWRYCGGKCKKTREERSRRRLKEDDETMK